MLIFDQLKRDHDKMRSFLEKIETTTTRAVTSRTELLKELTIYFKAHSKAEELFFYRAILRGEFGDDLTHDQAMESLDDHTTLESALAEIEDTDPKTNAWMQRFRFFKRSLERHFLEEEKVLFKKARTLVSKDKAMDLGEQFLEMKTGALAER